MQHPTLHPSLISLRFHPVLVLRMLLAPSFKFMAACRVILLILLARTMYVTGGFTEEICTPTQTDPSQFPEPESLEVNYTLTDWFLYQHAELADGFKEHPPGLLFSSFQKHGKGSPSTLDIAADDFAFPTLGIPIGEVFWFGVPHDPGQVHWNTTEEGHLSGEIQPTQFNFITLPGSIGTNILHTTAALAEPTKIRRFLKIVKRACLT